MIRVLCKYNELTEREKTTEYHVNEKTFLNDKDEFSISVEFVNARIFFSFCFFTSLLFPLTSLKRVENKAQSASLLCKNEN